MKKGIVITEGNFSHNCLLPFLLNGICNLYFYIFSDEKCCKEQYDLVLLDISDLNLINDTIELATKIKQIEIYKNIPIVVIITDTCKKLNGNIEVLKNSNIFTKIIYNPTENIEQFRNDIKELLI